ncbi:hypothetical protein HanIR_Chr14g0724721 [Helianthus annuus]|nr:hypothetical protein HanIR_Chr14g0724721 [Helianthus annuus]
MSISFHLPLLFLTFFVIAPHFLATARPITTDHKRPATTPDINLVLPEKTNSESVPCDEVQLLKRFEAGSYGSLFLSSLPKGKPVPPSGPNPRTNDVNN